MDELNQKSRAELFAEKWLDKNLGHEKQDSHLFWFEFSKFFVSEPENFLQFESPAYLSRTSFIDVWIDESKTIVEQKSRGKKLDKQEPQSDGALLTPYQQAKRYNDHRPYSLNARWIVICNFDEFWIYNMELDYPEQHVLKFKLNELPKYVQQMRFLFDAKQSKIFSEEYISSIAGGFIQKVRNLFIDSLENLSNEEVLSLNKLCIQFVFCLYAEDTEIFQKHQFLNYLYEVNKNHSLVDFKNDLSRLFEVLDTQIRPRLIDKILAQFPYVDGELFKSESLEILDRLDGKFNLRGMLEILIHSSERFNWSKISPTVFGAIFESILNSRTRRSSGIHFTSVKNIHKLIDPLFLNDLYAEFDQLQTVSELKEFQNKIAALTFLDPACGSGNFLTETFLSLRKLENEILYKLKQLGETQLKIKVSIENFFGIEVNDFAVQVAKLALWISESQMSGIENFLPLKRNANIIEANSLNIDWNSVISKEKVSYIIGNPPFVGTKYQSSEQKKNILQLCKALKPLDYVTGWYYKASQFIKGTKIKCAFVSTNSITQGEQVAPLWKNINVKINFAYKTFKWDSESTQKANVHCVIIGFADFDEEHKFIFDEDKKIEATNINGYLIDAPDVLIESRSKPICDVPKMNNGNVPLDGDALKIEADEYDEFIAKDPRSKKFIKRLIGGRELLHNEKRYVLWLINVTPNELKKMPQVMKRLKQCREKRLSMTDKGSQKLAETPTRFRDTLNPDNYIALPRVSSENRKYIPIAYFDKNFIPTNQVLIIPKANLFHFGILTSSVHMSWMRIVAGRLKSDYRYSKDIVYNNFPFPKYDQKIESTAQQILDIRTKYPDSSLADLYDPNTMPADLLKAHRDNDKAVLKLYGFNTKMSESEIVGELMKLYQRLTE